MDDRVVMSHALSLAAMARGRTSPNPLVGAIVVKDERIVGLGAHLQAGTPHAEVHALRMAGDSATGSTVYVTLEPCCHYGRTPPCVNALIDARVARVVIAMIDPNPVVAGKGIVRLREAGISVDVGILEQEAFTMNESYVAALQTGLPFVTIKSAMTLDGKIACATGDSRWISNTASREAVHRLRDDMDVVLTGSGTVIADDPQLTARLPQGGKQPLRVVVDSQLRSPVQSQVFDTNIAKTLVMTTDRASAVDRQRLEDRGVEVVVCPDHDGRVALRPALSKLLERGVLSILVEAGPALCGSLLDERLVRRMMIFIAPKIVGGSGPSPIGGNGVDLMRDAYHLRNTRVEQFGTDLCVVGDL